ncbi:MAG: leucyl/phenylalanyl-tRNA--protein transferase [Flavihumibacter sp.]
MPVFLLDETPLFPPVHLAEPDGLLAVGGDLDTERLLTAYRSGIFPWYDEPPIAWWCPDPRFVLFPDELRVQKSMRPLLNGQQFRFSVNENFAAVMSHCGQVKRPGQRGTWINPEMIEAYTKLHTAGYAWSAETWQNNRLVGGLYGVWLGRVFFGESMFATVANASKYAFIKWVQHLKEKGTVLIDCQVYTDHLAGFGARMIPRDRFIDYLQQYV